MQDAPNKFLAAIEALGQQVQEQQAAETARRVHDQIVEIQSNMFDKSIAYSNVIIFAGYAGAFGIWAYAKDQLTHTATASIALALGASIAVFVLFELYKMVFTTRIALKQRALVVASLPADEFLRRFDALKKEVNKDGLKLLMPIWVAAYFFSVISALVGGGILFYNVIAVLTGLPLWPK